MKNKYILALILVVSLVQNALCQNPCESMLKWGVFDYAKTEINEEQITNWASWADQRKFGSMSELKKESQSYGLSLPDIVGFDFGSNGSLSYQSKSYSSFTELVKQNHGFRSGFTQQVRSMNANALKDFRQCLSEQPIVAWGIVGERGETAQIFIKLGKPDVNVGKVKITDFVLTNCSIPDEKKLIGKQLGGNALPITVYIKDSEKDVTIDVRTNNPEYQGGTVTFWGRVPEPPIACDDGIQNGAEGGVDCGEPCPAKCVKEYRVTVKTSEGERTGTCERVIIQLNGDITSIYRQLGNRDVNDFEPGANDIYVFKSADIGNLNFLRINISNLKSCHGSTFDDWKVEWVQIENLTDNRRTSKIIFMGPWLGDGDQSKSYLEKNVTWN